MQLEKQVRMVLRPLARSLPPALVDNAMRVVNEVSHRCALMSEDIRHNSPAFAPAGVELEMDHTLCNLADWEELRARSAARFEGVQRRIVQHVRRHGLVEPLTERRFPRSHVRISMRNLRESLVAGGVNSRMRALLLCLRDECQNRDPAMRMLMPEATTRLAALMSKRFSGFTGTEYLPTEKARRALPHVQHLDVQRMPYEDGSFDLFVSAEVMEHVPRPDDAIREIARIIAPGGAVVSTFPFLINSHKNMVKAELGADGRILYHSEPEYHGNPIDPAGGSLVFTIPGWEVLDRYREAGLHDVHFRAIASARYGIVGHDIPFVLVLIARKRFSV